MSATTVLREVVMVEVDCCSCLLPFLVPADWKANRRKTGDSFWCPNGHSQHWPKTDETAALKATVENLRAHARAIADQRDAADRSNRALRGVITRQKNRAAAGQCPCCERKFENLAAHMGAQHPGWASTDAHDEPAKEATEE